MELLKRWNVQETGSPDAPAVVLIHGFLGRGADWAPVTAKLADRYRCITLDLPGHGEHTLDAGLTLDAFFAELETLAAALGLVNAGLVGYSMGGRVALSWALAAPGRFSALVLESAQPGIRDDGARAERQKQDAALSARLEAMTDQPAVFDEFLAEWYRLPLFQSVQQRRDLLGPLIAARMQNDPVQLARATALIGAGALPPVWDKLPAIPSPTLCIVGSEDRKYCGIAEEMSGLCPKLAVQTLENCGHNVHLENPEGYTTVLRHFLDAALRPGACAPPIPHPEE